METQEQISLPTIPPLTRANLPAAARAWRQLAKPGLVLAQVAAALTGMMLAMPSPFPAAPAGLGLLSLLLAAAGAAMANSVLDQGADRVMPRLFRRSQALQAVGSQQVLRVSCTLMGGALLMASGLNNGLVAGLLLIGIGAYLFLYTAWLKRRSPWGVLAGGIAGAVPPLVGAAAVTGTVTTAPLLLAGVIFLWQLPHFWLLALQCREEYQRAGVPVLPVAYGDPVTRWGIMAGTLLLIPATLLFRSAGYCSLAAVGCMLLAGVWFCATSYRVLYQTHCYRHGFRASCIYLGTILALLVLDAHLIPA